MGYEYYKRFFFFNLIISCEKINNVWKYEGYLLNIIQYNVYFSLF